MNRSYYTLTEVEERYQVTRSTLYRWINSGIFPAPIKLGPRMVRWRYEDLAKYEQDRGAKS